MRIFDINDTVFNDKSIGPVTSMCHEMIFGFVPIEHKGHLEENTQTSFSQETTNHTFATTMSSGKDVVDFYKNEYKEKLDTNVIPVWNRMVDILQKMSTLDK